MADNQIKMLINGCYLLINGCLSDQNANKWLPICEQNANKWLPICEQNANKWLLMWTKC